MRTSPSWLLVGLWTLATACGGSDIPRPRNLLIVCVDTLRADQLGSYGMEPSITPALDRLAASSVVFERAHSAASWTLPSVGSVFTSLFPSTTNLWTFESSLSQGFTTLAELFRTAGFDTHGIASHVYFDAQYGLQQGFETFDDELAHRKGEEGWHEVTSPLVRAKALDWLEERARSGAGKPWLLFLHFFDPHWIYLDHEAASIQDASGGELERYRSEIAFTDVHVGAVLDALEASPFADDTAVVFFSDHGESFLEHPPIQRHSYGLYEEELRVPLFLRVPCVGPRRVDPFVRTVDLFPTLVELFGLEDFEHGVREGASLVPFLLWQAREPRAGLAEIRLKEGFHANALVKDGHKLIEDVSGGRFLLFDLEQDPQEGHDLAAEDPARLEALKGELRAALETARTKGKRYAAGPAVEHTPEELQRLQELGYGGEDEPGPPQPR